MKNFAAIDFETANLFLLEYKGAWTNHGGYHER